MSEVLVIMRTVIQKISLVLQDTAYMNSLMFKANLYWFCLCQEIAENPLDMFIIENSFNLFSVAASASK